MEGKLLAADLGAAWQAGHLLQALGEGLGQPLTGGPRRPIPPGRPLTPASPWGGKEVRNGGLPPGSSEHPLLWPPQPCGLGSRGGSGHGRHAWVGAARAVGTHGGSGQAFALQSQAWGQNFLGTGQVCPPPLPLRWSGGLLGESTHGDETPTQPRRQSTAQICPRTLPRDQPHRGQQGGPGTALVRPSGSSNAPWEPRQYSPPARAAQQGPDFPAGGNQASGMAGPRPPACLQALPPPSQVHPSAPLRRVPVLHKARGRGRGP